MQCIQWCDDHRGREYRSENVRMHFYVFYLYLCSFKMSLVLSTEARIPVLRVQWWEFLILKVDQRVGQLSLLHVGITKTGENGTKTKNRWAKKSGRLNRFEPWDRSDRQKPSMVSKLIVLIIIIVIIIIDRPSYTVVDCRRPSFSGRCCSCLERITAPRHVCDFSDSCLKTQLFSRSFRDFLRCL